MNNKTEKTINIIGRDVLMRYCPATEIGFEQLSDKKAQVFIPDIEYEADGTTVKSVTPAKATLEDYIKLGCAAIIAAYDLRDEDAPVTVKDLLYRATPKDIETLVSTVVELRNAWYYVPKAIVDDPDEKPDESDGDTDTGGQKNA